MVYVLVTGGAGYIGSHVVRQLGDAGYDVITYDNESTGSRERVTCGRFIPGDLSDRKLLRQVFNSYDIKSILHFAASIVVPDSITFPLDYYANNTRNTLNLLQVCQEFNVNRLVFSSTAAVYGEPEGSPIFESSPTLPINPYGRSKLMSEWMIQDYSQASTLRYVILRYFNVAGANLSIPVGKASSDTTHLIRVACQTALGSRPDMAIFGTDFSTPDGTCVRDYIHVEDLAQVHLSALRYLESGGGSEILNCGYGKGYSVREVLASVKQVSGVNFSTVESRPRLGDPACIVADTERVRSILRWQPTYDNLDEIIRTAYEWEKMNEKVADLIGRDLH